MEYSILTAEISRNSHFTEEKQREIFQLFSDRLKEHSKGKEYYYQLFVLDSLRSIGKKAINFIQETPEGIDLDLEFLQGKVVLVVSQDLHVDLSTFRKLVSQNTLYHIHRNLIERQHNTHRMM